MALRERITSDHDESPERPALDQIIELCGHRSTPRGIIHYDTELDVPGLSGLRQIRGCHERPPTIDEHALGVHHRTPLRPGLERPRVVVDLWKGPAWPVLRL